MALSESDIKNLALVEIGQEPITGPSDVGKPARLANQFYPMCRDEVLASHSWNCATARATCALIASTPEWGFGSKFQLPSDFIRLVSVNGQSLLISSYRLEAGNIILSNDTEMQIEYISRVSDVTKFDHLMSKAIAMKLAALLSLPLTGSERKKTAMEQLYRDVLAEAQFADSRQGPNEVFAPGSWVNARYTGGGADVIPWAIDTTP